MKKIYVGIARDHSGSMSGLRTEAMNDYNNIVKQLKKSSEQEGIDTIVSSVTFGIASAVKREAINSSLNAVELLKSYTTGGSTPLFDAVGELIEIMESAPDANDDSVIFLIQVVTDGEENSSGKWKSKLSDKIKQLQATDRWTFTFRVPKGYASALANKLNIPIGNIEEWEQTEKGIKESSVKTTKAVSQYFVNAKSGIRGSSSFYTDLSGVSTKEVKDTLIDISGQVLTWKIKDNEAGVEIRDFVEDKGYNYQLGCGFYQLTKKVEVQGHKKFIIRHQINGKMYSGVGARNLLGIPVGGSIKLSPGHHGMYDVFVQSTAVNRKLVGGTDLLYWPKALLF
jgi:uncharacterized protein YegL